MKNALKTNDITRNATLRAAFILVYVTHLTNRGTSNAMYKIGGLYSGVEVNR